MVIKGFVRKGAKDLSSKILESGNLILGREKEITQEIGKGLEDAT